MNETTMVVIMTLHTKDLSKNDLQPASYFFMPPTFLLQTEFLSLENTNTHLLRSGLFEKFQKIIFLFYNDQDFFFTHCHFSVVTRVT